ncbi:S8 family serine peptidase [Candidatus Galacturonibacter soehngenii]|uniref:S8 family serine peptidase n=2 Tax=Candidatus Galacturonatibacter soehngenii TaxID=2307010 RepID=A0A7V7UC91_9FIRM|nr:S8 family serine peptidase [Candidatus Galacturonibacter soehngenii]
MKKKILTIICLVSIMTACSSNNKNVNTQWWMENTQFGININNVWSQTTGNQDIIVGIIDSGVDITNKNIKDSIYINYNEIADNEIDDDGNGYVDDINGWNFYDNTNDIYTAFTSDYHGTMIAGILTDKDYGIAPNIRYLPLKCFRGSEGSIEDVIKAIEYGYDVGVRLFNCSWDTNQYSEELYEVIQSYQDAIFVCSGGKNYENLDLTPVYPACYNLSNIICVGGITESGDIYEFSGYGNDIDIYAPGADIYSLMPENTYNYSDGTSLAVAIVTGAIALAKSIDPLVSCEEIKERFSESYNDFNNLNTLDVNKLCFGN